MGLRGRDAEIARIAELCIRARGGESGTLVIRGEAGVGKSVLLAEARRSAEAHGMRVLSATGLEAEAELPFAGLADLLRAVLDEIDELLPAQAAVLRGALALGAPTGADRFRIYIATLGLLAGAAEKRPMLLSVDDVQWLDRPSAEALLFVGRRVANEGIVLLMTCREGEPSPIDEGTFPELRLGGLDDATAERLLAQSARCDLSARVTARLIAATGGNPLALIEFAGLLSEAQLEGRAPLDEPLQVGSAIEKAFLQRVGALPQASRAALVIAAADDSLALSIVVAALSSLGLRAEDLEPAERAGLVHMDGARVRFHHPMVRSAIYQAASVAERRAAHSALADACPDGDALPRAWHRAEGVILPDEEIADALEQAAGIAMQRGGPVAAARAYRRAAELSTDSERGAQRLLRAAEALWDGSYAELALSMTKEALAVTSDPIRRADIVALRGQAEMWLGDAHRAFALLMEEADRMKDADVERATDLLGRAVTACLAAGMIDRAVAVGEQSYAAGLRAGGTALIGGQAALAMACGFAGDGDRVRMLGDPVLTLAEALGVVPETGDLIQSAALIATFEERYDEARRLLEQLLETAETSQRWGLIQFPLYLLAELDFRQGRWSDAYSHAVACEQHCHEYGHAWGEKFAARVTAQLQAAWGLESEARDRCATVLEFGERYDLESFRLLGRSVLGFLELTVGNPHSATDHLLVAARTADRVGARDPASTRFAPDLIESLVRVERPDDARSHLETLEDQARRSDQAWARGAAQRCRGLIAGDEEFEHSFEGALRSHEACGQPFELARTRLCYGERLRRARRRAEAREQLRAALDTFERLRAEPWASRTRTELEATGMSARSRSSADIHTLTPQELHVAVLVAQGATNREVAAELFLSPKTVEKHLGSAYRKLGIRSRSELARLVVVEGLESPVEDRVTDATVGQSD